MSPEQQQIEQLLAEYSRARNSHDVERMCEFFTIDADLIGATGRRSKGVEEIRRNFQREYAGVYRSSYAVRETEEIRLVKDGVAVVDGSFKVSGAVSVNEEHLSAYCGKFTLVMVHDGEWRIAAYRSMIPQHVFGKMGEPPDAKI